jgi:hypothetical protein
VSLGSIFNIKSLVDTVRPYIDTIRSYTNLSANLVQDFLEYKISHEIRQSHEITRDEASRYQRDTVRCMYPCENPSGDPANLATQFQEKIGPVDLQDAYLRAKLARLVGMLYVLDTAQFRDGRWNFDYDRLSDSCYRLPYWMGCGIRNAAIVEMASLNYGPQDPSQPYKYDEVSLRKCRSDIRHARGEADSFVKNVDLYPTEIEIINNLLHTPKSEKAENKPAPVA